MKKIIYLSTIILIIACGFCKQAVATISNKKLRSMSVFAEGEDFTLPKGWEVARGHGIDMYVPPVSGHQSIKNHGKGSATLDVMIPKNGTYTMWMWYTKWVFDTSIEFKVEQNGVIVGVSTFNTPEDKDAKWSYNLKKGKSTVKLKAGPARIILRPEQKRVNNGSPIDCVLLTMVKEYTKPNWHDFTSQCFVRFTILTKEAPPVVAKISGSPHFVPWFPTAPTIGDSNGKPVPSGTTSAWGDVSKVLSVGERRGTLYLKFKPAKKMPALWKVRVEFATKPSSKFIVQKIEDEWDGNVAGYILPGNLKKYLKDSPIETLNQATARHKATVDSFLDDLPGGKGDIRAKNISIGTSAISASPRLYIEETKVLARLGINTVKLDSKLGQDAATAANMHFPFTHTQLFLFFPKDHFIDCSFQPNLKERIDKFVTGWVEKMKKKNPVLYRNVRYIILGDEPSTPNGLRHMTTCEYCKKAFHNWLRVRKKSPSNFDLLNWDAVKPVLMTQKSSIAKRKLGWLSSQFAQESTPLPYKYTTMSLQKAFGRPIGTTANFSDNGMMGYHSRMSNGDAFNWFEFGRSGATSIPWTEDWMFLNPFGTPFLADVLLATRQKNTQPIGMYIIWGYAPPGDAHSAELRTISAVARGVKIINYWQYGPRYASTECASSEDPVWLRSMAYGNRVIALADDLLGPSMPPKREVAILWSQAMEQWPVDHTAIIERRMLHYAFTMQQIPVDFISEKDLRTSRLNEYKVLYLATTHFQPNALPALEKWVKTGGTLVVCGGGPDWDEIHEPWKGLHSLQGLIEVQGNKRRFYRAERPMQVTDTVLMIGSAKTPFPVTGYKAVLVPKKEAHILGRYKKGGAAIVENRIGKGRVLTFGFNPGMSLLTHLEKKVWRKRIFWKIFPKAEYEFIIAPIIDAGIQAPVSTLLGVDAARLDSPKGSVVTLANYTNKPIEKLTVKIRGINNVKKIVSSVQGVIEFTDTNGIVTVTLPLDTVDILKMYK